MTPNKTARSREADAFLDSRQQIGREYVSACEGWTAHEVTAHLAGNAAEITRHLDAYAAGQPVPATRSFEEREQAFREMSDRGLCGRLESEEERMRTVLDHVLADDPEAVIPWTGRQMAVAKFVPHMRNEFAIHRWDIVGDDDVSFDLLSQPELTAHAVGVLGEILTRRGRQRDLSPEEDFVARLHAPGAVDVRLVVHAGAAQLELVEDPPGDEPCLELDAAARTLVIWGRRPDQRGRFRCGVDVATLGRLQTLLSGY